LSDKTTYRRVRWDSAGGTGDAVKILILLNVILFLLQLIRGGSITWNLGLVPYLAWSKLRVWQFVTYMFLHGGLLHILFNMYALWMFGGELERSWGSRDFLKYYFTCGIGAGIFHTLVTPHSLVPTIGASGAVMGVMAAYAMTYPERELQLLLFFILPVRMKAKTLALVIAATSLLLGASGSPDGIAHFAHLGGMAVGYVYIRFAYQKFSLSRWFGEWNRKRRFRVVHRNQAHEDSVIDSVNTVLDRANHIGFDKLTPKEKSILKKASRSLKNGKKK
jgi:membrane associated rhomboid family serine protease